MFEFIAADQNFPFTLALMLMLGIALLEGIATLFGAGFSQFIDNFLPEVDGDMDFADADGSSSALSKLLAWLRIGQVPVLMLLVIFLTAFGLYGFAIQSFWQNLTARLLPSVLASVPALILTLPTVRIFGGIIGKIMPQDETDAVSEDSFVGRIAVITLGEAKWGAPAQAKLKDVHGTTHYVMVEPDIKEQSFRMGEQVLLVKRLNAVFRAIANSNPNLIDHE